MQPNTIKLNIFKNTTIKQSQSSNFYITGEIADLNWKVNGENADCFIGVLCTAFLSECDSAAADPFGNRIKLSKELSLYFEYNSGVGKASIVLELSKLILPEGKNIANCTVANFIAVEEAADVVDLASLEQARYSAVEYRAQHKANYKSKAISAPSPKQKSTINKLLSWII